MKEKLILIAILTGAPLISLGVSLGSQWRYQSEWEKVIRREITDVNEEALKSFTLEVVCADPKVAAGLGDGCGTLSRLHIISVCSWIALGLGIALPIVISVAGAVAKRNRKLLLSVFAPGLYFTNYAVAALVVIHTVLIVAAGWYGMTVLMERISFRLILVLGVIAILALLGVTQILSSLSGMFKKASTVVVGKIVSEKEAPGVWMAVTRLAKAAGTAPPSHLVVGLDPNFFVTEADVRCVGGNLSGRTMYMSLPLCRILTIQELNAIVSHELAHFRGDDTQFSLRFYPIYRGAIDSYVAAVSTAYGSEGSVNWALLPAVAVLGHFLNAFSSAESRISRERELVADRFAATMVSEEAIASALVKIHAYGDNWAELVASMRESLQEGSIVVDGKTYNAQGFFANVSALFAALASSSGSSVSLEALDQKKIPHPTDSHPPLAVRIAALSRTVKQVAQTALDANPPEPAVSLINRHEELEVELSILQQYLVCPELARRREAVS